MNKTKKYNIKHRKIRRTRKNNNQIYIFGYGSLINQNSRFKTLNKHTYHTPVILKKYANFYRHWISDKNNFCRFNIKYDHRLSQNINGVLFKVNKLQLKLLDKRENIYKRIIIPSRFFKSFFKNSRLPDDFQFAHVYISSYPETNNCNFLQSYNNTIISGALDIDKRFHKYLINNIKI